MTAQLSGLYGTFAGCQYELLTTVRMAASNFERVETKFDASSTKLHLSVLL
jgi:hypothetical protein